MAKRFISGWYNPALNSITPIDPIPLDKQDPFPHAAPFLPKIPPTPPPPQYQMIALPQPPQYQFVVPQLPQPPQPPQPPELTSGVVPRKIKKLKASNAPGSFNERTLKVFGFVLCVLAACSIGFAACDLAISLQFYFTSAGVKTLTWIGCSVNASLFSSIAPYGDVTGGFFWFFAATGIWAGIPVFVVGIFATYMNSYNIYSLNSLKYAAIFTFAFLAPAQVIFGIMDFVGSFSCLGGQANSDTSRIKLAMPMLVAISGVAQIIFGYYLANQASIRRKAGGAGPKKITTTYKNRTSESNSVKPAQVPARTFAQMAPPETSNPPTSNWVGFNRQPINGWR